MRTEHLREKKCDINNDSSIFMYCCLHSIRYVLIDIIIIMEFCVLLVSWRIVPVNTFRANFDYIHTIRTVQDGSLSLCVYRKLYYFIF